MDFEYNEYYTMLFTVPIIMIVIGIIVIFAFLYDIIFSNKLVLNRRFIKGVFIIVFFAALLITGGNQLNFSIRLDDINQVNDISGRIDSIDNVRVPPRFHFDSEVVNPKIISIDGKDYYTMTVGEFNVGDNIIIEYLPNSKVIMSINYLE